ncbi:tail tape measure protein [Sphingomonas sp. 28-62-11]|uniref:tail tape measure protein n=1 Tax=Sphingomonas sp. 28-62-11 TaxID=1970432 RepID=UPI000BC78F09|nr:MAG: tail tape measure protein [Sphingomonas sp. 28-62-11]
MDEEIDRLVVRIRADTSGFVRDVEQIRGSLGGPLERAADAAGRGIENALLRAVRTGKLGFDDLKRLALSALGEIASGAIRGGLDALFGGASGGLAGVIGGLLGAPGRATGGPVTPGRAYMVGERGPELFVPTSSGRIDTGSPGGGGRDVRIAITINAGRAGGGDALQALTRSSRQVARAVRAAIDAADS